MKLFKTLLIAIVSTMCMPAFADDYESLAVLLKDGSEIETSLYDFSVIRFEKGNMLFNNGNEVVRTFDMKTLQRMYFKSTPTSIESLAEDLEDKGIEIFTSSGIKVGSGKETLKSLPKGVYIVKQGNTVRKVMFH